MMLKKTSSLFVGNATAESIQNERATARLHSLSLAFTSAVSNGLDAVIITPKARLYGFEFNT